MNEKKFVLSENELIHLLECEMYMSMCERDGVDNWEWYGESRQAVIEDYCPGEPEEEMTFFDVAMARVDAGEFPELIDFQEML